MEHTTLLSLAASLGLPLVPQVIALILLRRIWSSGHTHHISLAAAGMVQVLSGLWFMRACLKLPLFFDAPLTPAYHEWTNVTMNAGPYMATSLSLLAGWFWVALAWSQRTRSGKHGVVSRTSEATEAKSLPAIFGDKGADAGISSIFVPRKAQQRQDKRKR